MRKFAITPSIINRNDEETVKRYLRSIAKQKALTPDEEKALAMRIQMGDDKALELLVKSNLLFVVSVAKTYQGRGLSLDDLIAEGNIGLLKAAKQFDPSFQNKFISYAIQWIQQSILEAFEKNGRTVRLPHSQQSFVNKIKRAQNLIEQRECRPATMEEVAEELGIMTKKVSDILQATQRCCSLDAPVQDDGDNSRLDIRPLLDLMTYEADEQAEEFAPELLDGVKQLMHSMLTERDIFIIKHSFGIGVEEMTQEEMGQQLGISRERVRQLLKAALSQLRKNAMHSYRMCS